MNRRQLVLFLTEWLIKSGTDWVTMDELGLFNIANFEKALRLGYIQSDKLSKVHLTEKGVVFIKENTK